MSPEQASCRVNEIITGRISSRLAASFLKLQRYRTDHTVGFPTTYTILSKSLIYILTERTVPKGNGMDHP